MADGGSGPGRTRRIAARLVVAAACVAAGWFARGAHDASVVEAETRRVADAARSPSAGFEIELFARTTEHVGKSTLCLLDGRYGYVVTDDGVANRNSHVDFDHYTSGSFTTGIQGGDTGQVIDLGDLEDLRREIGGPPLESLRWRDGSVVAEGDEWLVPDPVGAPDEMQRARRWLATVLQAPSIAGNRSPMASAQVKPGHVYLVRIAANRDPTEIVALLHVLHYVPGTSVRVRCVQL